MTKFIVANWKQNLNASDIQYWFETFTALSANDDLSNTAIVIAPSYPYLPLLHEYKLASPNIYAAGQDVSAYENGSHTSLVSASQLKDYCEFSIVGHSEINDPSETILLKVNNCIENDISPIICFKDKSFISQVKFPSAILAWEDPETISVGGEYRAINTADIAVAVKEIKNLMLPDSKFLYGGSVNRQNIEELGKIEGLDGVLVGHASLDPEHFYALVKAFVSSSK